jgi:hypothetical protein
MTAWHLPQGFVEHRTHHQIWWLKADWATTVQEALQSAVHSPQSSVGSRQFVDSELQTVSSPTPNPQPPTPKSGGRGTTQRIDVGERGVLIVRHYRRGGFVRHFIRDLYWDRTLRPFAELICTDFARQRGVPTVEVLGARVEWSVCGLYRGIFITREAEGYCTMWEWLQTQPTGTLRVAGLTTVAQAITRLHTAGIDHADLNLTNILVSTSSNEPQALLIDFDRARVFPEPLPRRRRTCNLRRLHRSLKKLDPIGQWYTPSDLEIFCRAYHGA